MKFLERLRLVERPLLGPTRVGPAWPRLAGVGAWLTVIGVHMAFAAVARSDAASVVVGSALAVVGAGWLAFATREAFLRPVAGVRPVVAALLWVAAGGLPLVFDRGGRPAAFFAVNGLLVLAGAALGVVALRRRSGGGQALLTSD